LSPDRIEFSKIRVQPLPLAVKQSASDAPVLARVSRAFRLEKRMDTGIWVPGTSRNLMRDPDQAAGL
jgi:hypothetical protein